MNKLIILTIASCLPVLAAAKTTVFGEANAQFYLQNVPAGSYFVVEGAGTEFGFRGDSVVSETETAFFDLTFAADVTRSLTPYTKNGNVGFKGDFGEVSIFYGDTPLSSLNDEYKIMSSNVDSIFSILGVNQANSIGVVVGDPQFDGVKYKSNKINESISLEFAFIPAEVVGGETGLSFAGHFEQDKLNLNAAFEINVEAPDTQIVRVNGSYKTGTATIGGTYQVAGNSLFDTSASHVAGYLKMPLAIADKSSNIKVIAAFNTASIDPTTKVQEFYTGFVMEIPFNDNVSSYSFVNIYMLNDMNDTLTAGGGGLKFKF